MLKRKKRSEIVTEVEMKVARNSVRGLQEALEATVPSFFSMIGLSISSYQK